MRAGERFVEALSQLLKMRMESSLSQRRSGSLAVAFSQHFQWGYPMAAARE